MMPSAPARPWRRDFSANWQRSRSCVEEGPCPIGVALESLLRSRGTYPSGPSVAVP